MSDIACAAPAALGDALYALPTARALAKKFGCKIDFYTTPYCAKLKALIEYQDCIDKLYAADSSQFYTMCPPFGIDHFNMGLPRGVLPIPLWKYRHVYQLGFAALPNKPLPQFIAEQTALDLEIGPVEYQYRAYPTLEEPYIVVGLGERGDKFNCSGLVNSPWKVVVVGGPGDYKGYGIDKTGMDFLDVATWIANSKGYIGASVNLVIAEGLPVPKIIPYTYGSFGWGELVQDKYHFFLKDPSVNDMIDCLQNADARIANYKGPMSVSDFEATLYCN
jgi:hypothetical protein